MNRSLRQDQMKTVSTKLSPKDVERFQVICEEKNWSQSEAIRYLIQSFIASSGDKETQQFYESFSAMNRVKNHFSDNNISYF
jgi:cyclophilin family peptidyl-prolyl cis-trans isomerase